MGLLDLDFWDKIKYSKIVTSNNCLKSFAAIEKFVHVKINLSLIYIYFSGDIKMYILTQKRK